MRTLILSLSLMAALAAQAEQGFYIKPHLNNITPDGCTLIWEAAEPQQGVVEYGLDANYGMTAEADEALKINRVRMTGLKPETEYFYKVTCGDDVLESTFITAPGESRPITFIMIGDSRRWGTRWEETDMATHAEQWDPEFYITQGDLVPNGHVYDQWPEHFNRFKTINHRYWMATARGNHEGSQIFDPENDWFAQYHELPGDGEPYAAFTWGNTTFVLISFEQTAASPKWLKENVPTFDSQYTILAHHFPVYCTGYYSPADQRKELAQSTMRPLAMTIDQLDIDLDLAGHTHIYERLYPLKDGKRNDREGTTFITNGGDIGGNFPEYFTAQGDDKKTMDQPTYTVFHMGEDRIWFRTFAWHRQHEEIAQIDYGVIWKDEAVPQAVFAKLDGAEGEELLAVIEDLGAMAYAPAAKALLPYMESGDAAVRQTAMKAIRRISNVDESASLLPFLQDEDLLVRREAARSLEIAMDPVLTPKVIAEATNKEQDEQTRISLIGALQFHAPAEAATDVLVDLLDTADRAPVPVRERAAYALARTAGEADIERIAAMFREEQWPYVTLRLGFALNELTGRRQSLDDKAPIGRSKPGDERDEFIERWIEWYEKQKAKEAA